MKLASVLLPALALQIAVLPIGLAAASTKEAPPAQSHPVKAVERNGGYIVEPGSTTLTVRRLLGEPARRLDRDHWLYENFAPADWKIDAGNCSTLVVTFVENRVADLRLANSSAVTALAANLALSASASQVARK